MMIKLSPVLCDLLGGKATKASNKPLFQALNIFYFSMKTTSSRDPNEIMQEIRKVLDKNNCDYEQVLNILVMFFSHLLILFYREKSFCYFVSTVIQKVVSF